MIVTPALRIPAMLVCLAMSGAASASTLAPQGCPISHCTPASTGLIGQPLLDAVTVVNSNSGMGLLHAEGCSGDGARLYCLFMRDKAIGVRKGTLKAIDTTTLKPQWGSAAAAGADLDPNSAAVGQVPVIFDDGSIAAGDGSVENLYSASGALLAQLSLGGQGTNFGLEPLSPDYGVVSQGNGVLTLVSLASWQNRGSLTLTDPVTQSPVNLVAPASASAGVLYALTYDNTHDSGTLYSVVIDPDTQQLSVRSTLSFTGRSTAKPVVVSPDISGLSTDLVLVQAPGLIGDVTPQNRILGVADSGVQLSTLWSIALAAPVTVAPTVDAGSRSLFYQSGYYIRQNSLTSGAALQAFNLRTIGGFPSAFRLNGHIGGSNAMGAFTLLLSGGVTAPSSAAGEYVMLFRPLITPTALTWSMKIADQQASYTGAFDFAPATQTGVMCPIAIAVNGLTSATLTRLCDH